ncbi:MAG: hypothetical protein WDN09_00485 [bacterium]
MKFNFESPKEKAEAEENKKVGKGLKNVVMAAGAATLMVPGLAQKHHEVKQKELPPIYVENKNDKRILDYKDSLNAWQQSKIAEKIYNLDTTDNYGELLQQLGTQLHSDLLGRLDKIDELNNKGMKLREGTQERNLIIDEIHALQAEQGAEMGKAKQYFNIKWRPGYPNELQIETPYNENLYTKRHHKPSSLMGDPKSFSMLGGESKYMEYPVFKKPVQPYVYKKPEIKKDTTHILQKAMEQKGKDPLPVQETNTFYLPGNPVYGPNGHIIGFYASGTNTFKPIPDKKDFAKHYGMHKEDYAFLSSGSLADFLKFTLKMDDIKIEKPE